MGRSGNTKGYKVFSINTTVRNPLRNIEFLEIIAKYDGIILTKKTKIEIMREIIRNGTYRMKKISSSIKKKYRNNELLNDDELDIVIKDNPQKTGLPGRLMTQVRALKDQGFLNLIGNVNEPFLQITPLGYRLLQRNMDIKDIYSKAMIGLHASNPQRTSIFNKSRPFLNTIFVINELKNEFNGRDDSFGGIWFHEFGIFVLSMKDCDYKKASREIREYRTKFGDTIDKEYIKNYLSEQGVNEIDVESIIQEYPDDVYRKFAMTGLLIKHEYIDKMKQKTLIDFDRFNIGKINALLNMYEDYSYINFYDDTDKYTEFLTNIELPWEESDEVKKEIISIKEQELQIVIDKTKSLSEQNEELDRIKNNNAFRNKVKELDLDLLKKELCIIGNNLDEKSKFDDISTALRLEWLIAIITAKIYGVQYVKSNMDLTNEGEPRWYATGGKADIEFESEKLYCLLEVTTLKNGKQQENSETTSVSDHLASMDTDKPKCSIFIAPVIHKRIVDYYQYCSDRRHLTMLPVTIDYYVYIIDKNRSLEKFIVAINDEVNELITLSIDDYNDKINAFRFKI